MDEKRISELEDIGTSEIKCKKIIFKIPSTQELWDNFKRYNLHVFGIQRENSTEEIVEFIKAKNFPKLMTGTEPQIQEAQ